MIGVSEHIVITAEILVSVGASIQPEKRPEQGGLEDWREGGWWIGVGREGREEDGWLKGRE